jgi:hypothetical protein
MDLPVYHVRESANRQSSSGLLGRPDRNLADRLEFQKIRHELEDGPPLRETIQVAALWDQRNLYVALTVFDSEVWATVTSGGFAPLY